MNSPPPAPSTNSPLRTLAWLFLRLGATCFGGPAAHIAIMRDEVVQRRGWMTDAHFLDLLGATNLIPGPNSTEMAIHIGFLRARWAGLVVAGACFIAPAMLIAGLCGWAWVRWHKLPAADALLYGVKPAVLAIVVHAMWKLARSAVENVRLAVLGGGALLASSLGVNAIVVLLGAGVLELAARRTRRPGARAVAAIVLAPFAPAAVTAAAATAAATLPALFFVFLKTGALLFGSGYVLLAYLRDDLVHGHGWLTEAQLLDAIAVGQMMPGPLFTTATFVGYVLLGVPGALIATAGIFLPAFVLVAATAPFVRRLRASPAAGAFLDGVNVAAVALMGVVAVQLAGAAFVDAGSIVIGVAAAVLLLRWRVNSACIVLGAAAAGWCVRAVAG